MHNGSTSTSRRDWLAQAAAMGLATALPASAFAADWRPAGTTKVVVPTPPGGPTDLVGRLLAQHLQTAWGKPVVVDNKGGGGGTVGAADFVRQKPDGSTLFIGNPGANATAYSIYRGMSYKADQFVPVCGIAKVAGLVSVHPSLPVNNLRELVAYVKAQPGKLNYATAGTGQSTHLAAAWFVQQAGLEITHVPYKGGAAALTAAVAGEVPILFNVVIPDMPMVRAGRLRALAVMTGERSAVAPEVPTMRESMPELLKDFDFASWYGVFLQRGAPPEIVEAVAAETRRFLDNPDTQKRMVEVGAQTDWRSPADFTAYVNAETAKFARIIAKEGLQLDIN